MGTLVAIAVVTVGCSSGAEPRGGNSPSDPSSTPATSPSDSTSDSASASPTGPPPLPEAAKGTSKKAAKAFVRHYVDVINHAMATGETQALAKASDSQCSSCNSVIERVTKLYSQGGSIKSNGWRVKTLSVLPDRPVDRPGLDVVLRLTPQVVTESRGEEPKTYNGGKLPTTFFLRLKHHHWIVDDWERAA